MPCATAVALALSVIAFSVAGCGGGSSSAEPDRPGASESATASAAGGAEAKARLIAQADAICKRLNVEIEAVLPKKQSRKEVLRVVPRNVVSEQRALRELEKLTPPPPLAREWRQMLGHRRALAGELAKFVASEKRNDTSAVKALAVSKKRSHAALEATKRSGFKDCSKLG